MSRKQASDKLLSGLKLALEIAGMIVMILPLFIRKRK